MASSLNRFIVLATISFVPFGGHFLKNSMSSLEIFMIEDTKLAMDYTKYGVLISSFSYSTLFMPLFGGRYIDLYGHHSSLLMFLTLSVFSISLFTFSLYDHRGFYFTLFSTFLFGCAHGNIVVTMRAVVSRYFRDNEIAFALGCTVGITCIGKMMARAVVAPVALATGNYIYAFLVVLVSCVLSWVMGWVYVMLSRKRGAGRTPSWRGALSLDHATVQDGEGMEEFTLEEGTVAKETTSLLGTSADTGSSGDSGEEEVGSGFHRVESLIKIRRMVTYGAGAEGMGGADGPVVVDEDVGEGEDGDILSLLKRERAFSIISAKDGFKSKGVRIEDSEVGGSNPSVHQINTCDLCPASKVTTTSLSCSFWLLAILHALFLMVFHLFPNISGHFLYTKWGYNPAKAGYVSSLLSAFVIVGAPLTGLIIDRTGGQLYVVFLSSLVTLFSYYLLTYTEVEPVYPVLMLSAAESTVPTILMALIPMSTERELYGRAFGIAEVFDAFGSIFGNVLIGYIRQNSPDYMRCMEAIIYLNILCIGLTVLLISRDAGMDSGVLNKAWHTIALRQKGRGTRVERGRQIRGVRAKQTRNIKNKRKNGCGTPGGGMS